jgi:hypothetical protein
MTYSSTYGIMVFGDNAVYGYTEGGSTLSVYIKSIISNTINIPSHIYNNILVDSNIDNPIYITSKVLS